MSSLSYERQPRVPDPPLTENPSFFLPTPHSSRGGGFKFRRGTICGQTAAAQLELLVTMTNINTLAAAQTKRLLLRSFASTQKTRSSRLLTCFGAYSADRSTIRKAEAFGGMQFHALYRMEFIVKMPISYFSVEIHAKNMKNFAAYRFPNGNVQSHARYVCRGMSFIVEALFPSSRHEIPSVSKHEFKALIIELFTQLHENSCL